MVYMYRKKRRSRIDLGVTSLDQYLENSEMVMALWRDLQLNSGARTSYFAFVSYWIMV